MSKNFNVVPENTNNYRNYEKKKSNKSDFHYIEQNVISYNTNGSPINKQSIKIKLDSSGNPEKYSNGRPVILGKNGYPINNKGQILKFDQKTGDLIRNRNRNPIIYIPGFNPGFKIPTNEIKFRYPTQESRYSKLEPRSFLNSEVQGQIQTQVPTVFGKQKEYIPGGIKVNTKTPESLSKFNERIPGNSGSPLLQQPGNLQKKNSNKGALSRIFGKFSIFGKK
jgi:hypothetical protein